MEQWTIPKGRHNRPGYIREPRGLLFHATSNWDPGADATMHARYLLNTPDSVSWHVTVDANRAIQHLPFNESCYAAGDGAQGYYNYNWINVEICCNRVKQGEPLDRETYDHAVKVIAGIMLQNNLTDLRPHKVVYGKDCPHHTLFDHESFEKDVLREMEGKPMQVTKERIYADNGVLKRCDGDYSKKATDVRWIKFEPDKIRLDFIYEEGAKVSELREKYDADYAFNFPFFWQGKLVGNSEDEDVLLSAAYGDQLKRHEFACVDGKPLIGQIDVSQHQDFVVQGAPLLIEPINGKPSLCWDYYRVQEGVPDDIGETRAQRTFIGIDAAGALIVAVADGRTTWDEGLTLEEMALFMLSKGAVWALNGDGGGSSILCDRTGALNQKENTGENERTVHHAVLVYFQEHKNSDYVTWGDLRALGLIK